MQIDLTFEQVLSIVRQLPKNKKIKISKELEKDTIDSRLTRLRDTFKTDELNLDTITQEVESVRQELYEMRNS